MPKFTLAELPRELGFRQDPTVRVEGDAIYVELCVFSRKDPADIVDFEFFLDRKTALQFAADLLAGAKTA